jgi:GGDEF domain-containing protein
MDLDQFKIVNDTCGHEAGDELLKDISEQMRHCIRGSDLISRLGGDEFGIVLPDCATEADAAARRGFAVDWNNESIVGGGMDFSDTVEPMYVFGFENRGGNVGGFFDEFL